MKVSSGRFDRQVTVSLPDKNARIEILKVHAKNKVLAKNITLEYLAKRTPGFSGADLENLLNEAALLAVRRNKKEICRFIVFWLEKRIYRRRQRKRYKRRQNFWNN